MLDAFGLNPKDMARDPHSVSRFPGKGPQPEAGRRRLQIVLAEDNEADTLLIREALEHHGLDVDLIVKADGQQMMQWIEKAESKNIPCPDLVLLDLNLPRHNGTEILGRLRKSPVCADVPVVIVTSSMAEKDRQGVAELRADAYFTKPSDFDQFMLLGSLVRAIVGIPEDQAPR
jgi:two-component system response regulator